MRIRHVARHGLSLLGMIVGVAGCEGGASAPLTGRAWPDAWSYPEQHFVVDTLVLPITDPEVRSLGFDLDGNGTIDNRLGQLLAVLPALAAFSGQAGATAAPVQDDLDEQVAHGDDILLLSLYSRGIWTTGPANLWTFLGQATPLTDGPQPGATFVIDTVAGPTDAYLGGRIKGDVAVFGGPAATMSIRLPFLSDSPLRLLAARVELEISVDGSRLINGNLGGAVAETEVNDQVIPGLTASFDAALATGCAARTDGPPPDGGVAPCQCQPGSWAAVIQGDLDLGNDCRITRDDVQNNSLLGPILAGDVTVNGVRAVSLGLGFTAVAAHFDHPAPPVPTR